ncbi:GH36-type glycosyl hydrolase domain-containing protein [Nitrospira sp. NS4]|uniref:GH36-type glycosyl hydrolase domain-containing protein n=1 Tax=Nitrospira sp. NS4 TaxID=3414498 RepID=UPI003C2E3E7B
MDTVPLSGFLSAELEEPIRAELFGVERLEQHAESLAVAQVVTGDSRLGALLMPRVLENGRVLVESYRTIARAIRDEKAITPAAEWLVDNFHIVDEQLREIVDDLPPGYYRQLPKLASGHLQHYPRVFGVAWAFVAHTDSRFDPDMLRRFVAAYQRVQPLTIGELWAVAISLRIVLIENLRRLTERIVHSRAARLEADELADSLLGSGALAPEPSATALRRFEHRPLDTAFAVQLVQRLRDLDPKVRPVLRWLDERLAAQGTTADDMVHAEHQQQAAMSVTVRNIITSMRLTSAFDWADFFESVSPVDTILRGAPGYAEMDFVTRDTYRHAIEDLSRGTGISEIEVTTRVVHRAMQAGVELHASEQPERERHRDPGYYLISQGRRAFEGELGYRVSWKRRLVRWYVQASAPGYLGSLAVVTAMVLALPLWYVDKTGVSVAGLAWLALVALIPASDVAMALINRTVMAILVPRPLPRMALRNGIPKELRTIVVVPTLLTDQQGIDEQVERLEVHYLANADDDLRFALLSDWRDAPSERMPGDAELLARAVEGIAHLNKRYGPAAGGGPRFVLFHRRRVWNESEHLWMGWERKRGKLHELNKLLRGSTSTTFMSVGGLPPEAIPSVRFVITLDADTRLPRGAARRLIGTMAHPLNRPRFDPRAGRVLEGYGVVQPRITPSLPGSGEGSYFQQTFSGPSGVDPYASAVSDVYQDLFREGSYTGKGIYEIDAFEAALADKVPDNAMLSHDLFEGLFARAALATDIELFEAFPAHYEAAAARQHRWARGDWQLLPWLFGRGHTGSKPPRPVRIPTIGRWKMVDNLRRTLSAPTACLTLIVGWLLPEGSAWVWSGFILSTIAIPSLLSFVLGLYPHRPGVALRTHFRGVGADLTLAATQIVLTVTFLAHQAWLMTDAIVRTLGRLAITRTPMLEWVTAAQAEHAYTCNLRGMYRRMAGSVVLAVLAGIGMAVWGWYDSWAAAAPFLLLWTAAPAAARWVSLPPPVSGAEPVTPADARTLRLIARRTWRFFETFVSPEDHALPPDNFQEDPKPVVAHRTSPTNIGLYLLSTLVARDLGWLGTVEAAERLEATLATMQRLELCHGHFYNWYDTRTLHPLDPKYVSSVDSGNLAGHLLVLSNGCRDLIQQSSIDGNLFAGVDDAIRLLRDALAEIPDQQQTHTVTRKQLSQAVEVLAMALRSRPGDAAGWTSRFGQLNTSSRTVADMAQALSQERGEGPDGELRFWADAIRACVESHLRDVALLLPWIRLSAKDLLSMIDGSSGPAPEWAVIAPCFHPVPTLANAPERFAAALRALERLREEWLSNPVQNRVSLGRIEALADAIRQSAADVTMLTRRLSAIAQAAEHMVRAMDFAFLFDPTRKLLSIGYRVTENSLDPSCYDLLASEARLASFVAIAKGDVPASHWFHLGRALTPVGTGSALVSWSGSIFEYLMPALVMRFPAGSLLSRTYDLIVHRQIQYGAERGVPWGVSESAYNARDLDLTYQYSSFGVPGLGLKRGLIDDVVVAPYATALAAMIDPAAATQGFTRLAEAGGRGVFGFYEALDYTGTRVPEGAAVAVVKAYMSHHQGMALVAIANVLNDGVIRSRFHAEPMIRATELLLQERTPRDVPVTRPRAEEVSAAAQVRDLIPPVVRRFTSPHEATPRTHLLSNGQYAVMVTAAGSGYSRWRDIAVTRWREDATRDNWGSYLFLRDMRTGSVWSAGYQPSGVEPDDYEVSFCEERAEIVRRDGDWSTTLEVVVSSEDDAEVRRLSISNMGASACDLQVTSYAELALAPQAADVAHPAFGNLFVQTEFVPEVGVLLATRRRRSEEEPTVWVAHVVVVEGETVGALVYETDRARFLGRGNHVRTPVSMIDGRPLSNTVGSVLDPVMSLRRTVRVPAGGTVHVVFSTIAGSTREQVLDLAHKYRDSRVFERAVSLAWTQAQVQLHHLGIETDEAQLFQRLANAVLYADATLRPSSEMLAHSTLDRTALWAHGISGDLPIVLASIDKAEDVDLVRQLLRAHEYWRMRQLAADVVILNEKASSYEQGLQGSLEALVRGSRLRLCPDTGAPRGSIYLLRTDLLSPQDRLLLQQVARVVLLSRRGSLAEQVTRLQRRQVAPSPTLPVRRVRRRLDVPLPDRDLEFFNGLGGFADDGREYVTILGEGLRTPRPWINVIANPSFGFLVSESGSGFTWSVNSHENQLTPWSNDPITDPSGEAIYIRDEDSKEVWTPTALPIRDDLAPYAACHGQGYSRFHHGSHGILVELLQFVPPEDPIKISRLTLQNASGRSRHLSITAYAEWVLGSSRSDSAPYIITEIDQETGALFARNVWGGEFGGRIAFADLAGKHTSWTGDRAEFLGRNGTYARPLALELGGKLSGRVGAGLDPCATLQLSIELAAGERAEIVWFLGQTEGRAQARLLVERYRDMDVNALLGDVIRRWDDVLGAVQVRTPERAMDVVLNRWVLYQTLACRVWARAAFYQLSGAYGFRDQLQDVMALSVATRDVTREHLLRAAARQFVEGDVQHWWHPPSGRGVRTRISDDLLWLPYAVIQFLEVSGDMTVLDEPVPFLEGETLAEGQQESYFQPRVSETTATLFEHCARALDRSLAVGSHGLPLMGSGDWNDGMNRVGQQGKGESVWLGWFLHTVLWEFAKVAASRGEHVRAETWRLHVSALKAAIERDGWDGEWYRRAYCDDGTPLGSAAGRECRIDSIAQSWGVISGAADPARGARAMAAVEQYLVNRRDGLIRLLTPPFDRMPMDPGYIKGYVPGIRENGGQYTHAAVWTLLAFVALGDGDKAGELFRLLNPVHRIGSRANVQRYKVEPYVLAGDVYAEPPHVGRGGWTWYSGAAGWFYRAGVEWMLGFRLRGETLCIDPCIPSHWPGYSIQFRYHSALYDIAVENPRHICRGVTLAELDGQPLIGRNNIPLVTIGEHRIRIVLG